PPLPISSSPAIGLPRTGRQPWKALCAAATWRQNHSCGEPVRTFPWSGRTYEARRGNFGILADCLFPRRRTPTSSIAQPIGGAGAVMTSHSRYNNVEITDVARYFTIVGKLCGKAIYSECTWLTQ